MDGSAIGEKIDIESVTDATQWARHLENHARRVYSLALNPQIHSARSLAQKIKQGKIVDGARLRDIYRHQWSNLKTRAAVDMAIAVLIECNWVQVEEVKPAAGAPLEVLRLNPDLQISEAQSEVDKTDTIFAKTSVSSVKRVFGYGANS
jgi:hypothetical protein